MARGAHGACAAYLKPPAASKIWSIENVLGPMTCTHTAIYGRSRYSYALAIVSCRRLATESTKRSMHAPGPCPSSMRCWSSHSQGLIGGEAGSTTCSWRREECGSKYLARGVEGWVSFSDDGLSSLLLVPEIDAESDRASSIYSSPLDQRVARHG